MFDESWWKPTSCINLSKPEEMSWFQSMDKRMNNLLQVPFHSSWKWLLYGHYYLTSWSSWVCVMSAMTATPSGTELPFFFSPSTLILLLRLYPPLPLCSGICANRSKFFRVFVVLILFNANQLFVFSSEFHEGLYHELLNAQRFLFLLGWEKKYIQK